MGNDPTCPFAKDRTAEQDKLSENCQTVLVNVERIAIIGLDKKNVQHKFVNIFLFNLF